MKSTLRLTLLLALIVVMAISLGCSEDNDDSMTGPSETEGLNPDDAPVVSVDRFSADAGMLMVRDGSNGLPEADEPINFDSGEPFITQGLGPNGEMVEYYNFDVQPTTPAPIFVLIREGEMEPVAGQLNIIDVIPGDDGYNDFWDVHFVTVEADYVANTVHSYDQIMEAGYEIDEAGVLVNCPVVPMGSTASKRYNGGDSGLTRGWYKDQVVYYFNFAEKDLMPTGSDMVPLSPIYVSFNINPDQPDGGPASGFMTEMGTAQTHNVIATLPEDASYSPLWSVNPYDNADFNDVYNLMSASMANVLDMGVATVNCPVVSVEPAGNLPMDPDDAPKASIDRFAEGTGMLMVRDASNGLPEANEPINFDNEPFITQGLGPDGQMVEYYNFDVQSTTPAPIYVLFREGESDPVEGQLNIVDVIPGDDGYNDFWDVHFVTVPANYLANTIHSYDQIMDGGYEIEEAGVLVNCPIVPDGSTASKRYGGEDNGLTRGWYKDQVVYYFNFAEKDLAPTGSDMVPLSPIYVCFNINPDQPDGGPASGFKTEMGSSQTHNVIATVPMDEAYSPLWSVSPYDNADFADVMDLDSALMANILDMGVAFVNCPVVTVQ